MYNYIVTVLNVVCCFDNGMKIHVTLFIPHRLGHTIEYLE